MTCDGTTHDILPKKSVTANLTVEEMKINSFVAQNGEINQVRFDDKSKLPVTKIFILVFVAIR